MLIGVDIENIDRFELSEGGLQESFFKRIYTDEELKYCLAKAKPSQHLAARFAAKEAIQKIFGSIEKNIDMRSIEIINRENGSPSVKLHDQLEQEYRIQVSLSHCNNMAISFAVAENIAQSQDSDRN